MNTRMVVIIVAVIAVAAFGWGRGFTRAFNPRHRHRRQWRVLRTPVSSDPIRR